MLDLVAWAEGTGNSYNMIYGGETFTDFSAHPDRVVCRTSNGRTLCSAAAGRYQFMPATWEKVQSRLNLPDFSPQSQDKAAIQLMKDRGCYAAAVRGDVAGFADRCWQEWASFHSANGSKLDQNQQSHDLDTLQAKYQEFLGSGDKLKPPLPTMTVTSPMSSARRHPVTGEVRPHNGTDYACKVGDPIVSPIAGKFKRGNHDPEGFGDSWGTVSNEKTEITFGHTEQVLVGDGAQVTQGQPILLCGNKGTGTGAHLHIEVRREGALINPESVF